MSEANKSLFERKTSQECEVSSVVTPNLGTACPWTVPQTKVFNEVKQYLPEFPAQLALVDFLLCTGANETNKQKSKLKSQ